MSDQKLKKYVSKSSYNRLLIEKINERQRFYGPQDEFEVKRAFLNYIELER